MTPGLACWPPRFISVIDLLAPALVGGDQRIEPSAAIAGVAAGGAILFWRRSALLTAIVVAAAVTALLRAVG